jgi:beta-phosphoglucomutase-like phosphatase (HAD superfamily)
LSNRKEVGLIWDIDGVIVDSPHEEAWRITARRKPWSHELSSDFYFAHVASRPRYEGGDNILQLHGVYEKFGAKSEKEKNELLKRFCSEKNELIRKLIREGKFRLFPDAVNLLLKAKSLGILQASASASKNARDMLIRVSRSRVITEVGGDFGVLGEEDTLFSIFDVNACGIEGSKEDIQKFATERLNALSGRKIKKFIVFEDAPSGIKVAKSLGYYAVGVLRIGSEEALRKAGADLVTRDLEKLRIEELLEKCCSDTA